VEERLRAEMAGERSLAAGQRDDTRNAASGEKPPHTASVAARARIGTALESGSDNHPQPSSLAIVVLMPFLFALSWTGSYLGCGASSRLPAFLGVREPRWRAARGTRTGVVHATKTMQETSPDANPARVGRRLPL
jgi:hypothetical protein